MNRTTARTVPVVLLIAVAGLAYGVAAADGDRTGTEITSGYLRTIEPSGTVSLDEAQILDGEEAVEAAREAGDLGPDGRLETDFYVSDPDDHTRTLQITDDTTVELFDCTAECELRAVDTQDFLDGTAEPLNGDGTIYTLELDGDEVVSLVEQYLP